MSDRISPGSGRCIQPPREAVCVHTRKVYDSCRDKECLKDLRVYLTKGSQEILDYSMDVKAKSAELLWAYIDVEPIPFNKGYYTIDVKYFYKITAEVFSGNCGRNEITGLATFDKRTVLFGSEGSVRIFSSQCDSKCGEKQSIGKTNLPIAVVEAVDPVVLGAKVTDREDYCGCSCDCGCKMNSIPDNICSCFDEDILLSGGGKKLYVTLGQFSIIKLERDIQLLMPSYDICFPSKECSGGSSEDPCELFQRFKFPVDEFYPPKMSELSAGEGRCRVSGCVKGFNGFCR